MTIVVEGSTDLRGELARVLERDPENLADGARLREDLGLDSLAMMTLATWLRTRGVDVTAYQSQPARVGEVLALLEKAATTNLSIRITPTDAGPTRGAGLTQPADLVLPGLSAAAPGLDGPRLAPVLSNQEVRLTTVNPNDVPFLYALATDPETCFRWRYRGAPPPIDRFASDLWAQVLMQFVVRRTEGGEPVGHVIAYGADMGQGYAYVGAVFQPRYTGAGVAARAAAMFVRYLFHTYPLRKLYIEVPGFNWAQMSSGEGRLFEVEGIMRNHEHYAGRYWDRYLCAIYPDHAIGA